MFFDLMLYIVDIMNAIPPIRGYKSLYKLYNCIYIYGIYITCLHHWFSMDIVGFNIVYKTSMKERS